MALDENLFLSALNNGNGFSGACIICMVHPKDATNYIRKNKGFEKRCNEAIQNNYKALLVLGNQHFKSRQMDKWKANMEYMKSFKSELVLWESFCKKKDIDLKNPEVIFKAHARHEDIDDMLISIGMTKSEFVDLMFINKQLLKCFTGKIGGRF